MKVCICNDGQFGVSRHNNRLCLRHYLCLQQIDNLECQDTMTGCVCITTRRVQMFLTYPSMPPPPPHPASHSHPHFPPPPPATITTQRHDRYISVTHLWNRFQPATVTAGTITLLKRISSNVCVSKAYAEDALLFVHTRF